MKIKALLFDLDGTLVNSIPLITLTFEKVFQFYGLPWQGGEVLKTIGLPLREIAEIYLPGRAEEFMDRYSLFQREKHRDYVKLYPGTIKTLQTIKAGGCCAGVVTSKRRAPALADMEDTGLNEYVDVTVTVEDVSRPKPNPEPVITALNLLHIHPENAVFVGDSWYDIMAGQQAGVTTIGVTWGMATREQLAEKKAEYIVDSWQELMNTLNTLGK